MGNLVKYLLYAVLAFFLFIWCSTMFKSCNKKASLSQNATDSLDNASDKMGTLAEETKKSIFKSSETRTSPKPDLDEEEFTEKGGNTGRESEMADLDDEDMDYSKVVITDDEKEEEGEEGYIDDSEDEEEEEEETLSEVRETSHDGGARYMVIAGSFENENNAGIEAKRIQKLGYDAAEVVKFDRSNFYSVCVARYFKEVDAVAMERRLKQNKVECYVHKRRGKAVQ